MSDWLKALLPAIITSFLSALWASWNCRKDTDTKLAVLERAFADHKESLEKEKESRDKEMEDVREDLRQASSEMREAAKALVELASSQRVVNENAARRLDEMRIKLDKTSDEVLEIRPTVREHLQVMTLVNEFLKRKESRS
jgi:hypothetical protein